MQFAVTWTIVKNWKIVAMFSIVGHDKGEVDNVYSLAKLALRRFVRTGGIISTASNYVPFLQNIFDDKTDQNL